MKLIIAGSRDLEVKSPILTGLLSTFGLEPEEIVCGGATGIDAYGAQWGKDNGVPVKNVPANWDLHGKAAGPIRNKVMAVYADALLLIWDGKSRGSANMRYEMCEVRKPVYEVILRRTHV